VAFTSPVIGSGPARALTGDEHSSPARRTGTHGVIYSRTGTVTTLYWISEYAHVFDHISFKSLFSGTNGLGQAYNQSPMRVYVRKQKLSAQCSGTSCLGGGVNSRNGILQHVPDTGKGIPVPWFPGGSGIGRILLFFFDALAKKDTGS